MVFEFIPHCLFLSKYPSMHRHLASKGLHSAKLSLHTSLWSQRSFKGIFGAETKCCYFDITFQNNFELNCLMSDNSQYCNDSED